MAPSPRTPGRAPAAAPRPGAPPAGDLAGLLEAGFGAGLERYGPLDLGLPAYDAHVRKVSRRALEPRRQPDDEAALAAWIARLVLSDLYLTCACEADAERAWDVLDATHRQPLHRCARRRGVPPAEAAALAAEVLAHVAGPAYGHTVRRRIGMYEGRGTLLGWLVVILARRWYRRKEREREAQALSAQEQATGTDADPAGAAEAREAAGRLVAALEAAWASLEEPEALTLLLKHAHGVDQRTIAGVLETSEPTVSRLARRAIAKMRCALQGFTGGDSPAAWAAMADAVRGVLARRSAEADVESLASEREETP